VDFLYAGFICRFGLVVILPAFAAFFCEVDFSKTLFFAGTSQGSPV